MKTCTGAAAPWPRRPLAAHEAPQTLEMERPSGQRACLVQISSWDFILKNIKYLEKWKEFYGNSPYFNHPDPTINNLLFDGSNIHALIHLIFCASQPK